jgi:hypothetical protein
MHAVLVEYYNLLGVKVEKEVGGHEADERFDIAAEKTSMLLNALGIDESTDEYDDDLKLLLTLAAVRSQYFSEILDWIEANPEMIENLLLDRAQR